MIINVKMMLTQGLKLVTEVELKITNLKERIEGGKEVRKEEQEAVVLKTEEATEMISKGTS